MKRNIAFTALCFVLFCCVSMAQADVLTSEYQDYSINVSDKFLHGTSGFHGDVNNDGDEEFVTAKMAYAVEEQFSTFPVYIYDKNGKDITTEILDGEMRVQLVKRMFFLDFNGDGKTDIYTIGHGWEATTNPAELPGEEDQLWLSGTDGKLHRAPLPVGKAFNHEGDCADIDNDGDIDIFVCAFGTPQDNNTRNAYFLINNGTGTFTFVPVEDRLERSGDYDKYDQTCAAFGDFNNDGNIDLVLGVTKTYSKNPIVIFGNGKGHFSGIIDLPWPKYIGEENLYTNTIAVFDFNNDGYPDIFIAGQYEPLAAYGGYIQILKNNGGNSFTDVTTDFDMDGVINWTSRKIDIIDYDNNGFKDVVIAGLIPVWQKYPDFVSPPFHDNAYIFKNDNYNYTKISAKEFFGNHHSDFGMGTLLAMSNDKAKFSTVADTTDGSARLFHMFSYTAPLPTGGASGGGGGGCNIGSYSFCTLLMLFPLVFLTNKN